MGERTVRIILGDRLTAFAIGNPSLVQEELTQLPPVRGPGTGGGIDTNLPWGPSPEEDGSTSVAFDRRTLGPEQAEQYAAELANKLGAIVVEPGAESA